MPHPVGILDQVQNDGPDPSFPRRRESIFLKFNVAKCCGLVFF